MALTDKKYNSLHGKTGSDKNSMKAKFDEGHQHVYVDNPDGGDPALVALIYQIGQLEEELDYLRTEISNNKDKTGISTSQVSAITANTAKTGITSQQATDISDNKTATSDNRTEAKRLGGLIDTNTRSTTNNASTITALVTNKLEVVPNLNGSNKQRLTCAVTEKRGAYMLNFTYQDTDKATGKILIKTGSIQLF